MCWRIDACMYSVGNFSWELHQEMTAGTPGPDSRKDGFFQHIRFALLTPEQLTSDKLILVSYFIPHE